MAPPPVIDVAKLKRAWDANVDTQRELIRVVEKTAEDNAAIMAAHRWVVLLLAAMVIAMLALAVYVFEMSRTTKEAVAEGRRDIRAMRISCLR